MSKKPFTTRIDEEVLAIAQRLADSERRSVTSLIEVAVLAYATRHGVLPSAQDETPVELAGPQDDTVTDDARTAVPHAKRPVEPKPPADSGAPPSVRPTG
jgi:hypothetical protein